MSVWDVQLVPARTGRGDHGAGDSGNGRRLGRRGRGGQRRDAWATSASPHGGTSTHRRVEGRSRRRRRLRSQKGAAAGANAPQPGIGAAETVATSAREAARSERRVSCMVAELAAGWASAGASPSPVRDGPRRRESVEPGDAPGAGWAVEEVCRPATSRSREGSELIRRRGDLSAATFSAAAT